MNTLIVYIAGKHFTPVHVHALPARIQIILGYHLCCIVCTCMWVDRWFGGLVVWWFECLTI